MWKIQYIEDNEYNSMNRIQCIEYNAYKTINTNTMHRMQCMEYKTQCIQ